MVSAIFDWLMVGLMPEVNEAGHIIGIQHVVVAIIIIEKTLSVITSARYL